MSVKAWSRWSVVFVEASLGEGVASVEAWPRWRRGLGGGVVSAGNLNTVKVYSQGRFVSLQNFVIMTF